MPEVRPLRVLVVEDDPGLAALVVDLLRRELAPPVEVAQAPTVRAAIDALAAEAVDRVVHDLSLPDGGPRETLAALRLRGGAAPLVVLSGEEDGDVAVALVHDGAQDVLVKGRASDDAVARAVRHAIERHRVERELRDAHERFRQLFDHAPIGMAVVDLGGRFVELNDAFAEICGHRVEDLLGTPFAAITHPDDLEADLELATRLLAGDLRSYAIEKRYVRADGEHVWALLSASLVRGPEGAPRHFIAQVQDVSDRRRVEHELRDQASRDALTGVANRRAFLARLAHRLDALTRAGGDAALLVLDVDDFKAVNDRFGHAAGDEVLRALASRLARRLRRADVVGRLGGDEFAVLLADVTRSARGSSRARSRGCSTSRPCGRARPRCSPS